MDTISIVMPVYNEASTIESAIKRVLAAPTPGWKKHLVIVDDGSTDGTVEVLRRWEKSCTILYQSKNQGKGAALSRGFEEAHGDLVLIQDADLEYSPTDYPILLEPFLQLFYRDLPRYLPAIDYSPERPVCRHPSFFHPYLDSCILYQSQIRHRL